MPLRYVAWIAAQSRSTKVHRAHNRAKGNDSYSDYLNRALPTRYVIMKKKGEKKILEFFVPPRTIFARKRKCKEMYSIFAWMSSCAQLLLLLSYSCINTPTLHNIYSQHSVHLFLLFLLLNFLLYNSLLHTGIKRVCVCSA